MSTSWRKLRKKIEFECNHIYENSPILLMVSGGVDSMFLLDFMSRCDVDFDVVHFQHGIREDDHEDYELVVQTVNEINDRMNRGIRIFHGQGEGLRDIPNQEAEAYKQRWEFASKTLMRLRRDEGNSKTDTALVITAHHLNDNIESTIMNLLRGKQHNQLSMKHNSYFTNFTKWKPLLEIPKSEIIEQATRFGLKWREDNTNQDNRNERNWIRNVIIPQIMERRNIETSMFDAMMKGT